MGWSEFGKLAKSWLEAEKTELLTTDRHKRAAAERESDEIERTAKEKASDDAAYALLDRVLPADLATAVRDARPENRAARQEQERRAELAERAPARVQLRISGAEHGELDAALPCRVSEPRADEPQPSLLVELEVPDPVAFGSTTFSALSVLVPAYRGPGRYDLLDLWRRAERGEVAEWELTDTVLRPLVEGTDLDWMWHDGAGAGVIEVGDSGLRLDLPMSSAANEVRLQGSIDWSAG